MSPKYLYDVYNGYFSKSGTIKKRFGYNKKYSVPITAKDTNKVLLINFDGADAATTHIAETGQTVTFVGNAQLDTAQKKFGVSSFLLDGTGDYGTVPDNINWSFGAGDFIIDIHVRFASLTNEQRLIGQVADSDNYWFIGKHTASNANALEFYFKIGGVVVADYTSATWAGASTTNFHHLRFARIGSSVYMWADGTPLAPTETVAIGTNNLGNVAADLCIGSLGGNQAVDGWIDNVLIQKGNTATAGAFTPPTRAHNLHYNSTNTVDILAYYEAVYDDESTDYFCCSSTTIYRWNASAADWDILKELASTATYFSIAQYGDEVLFSDGINAPQTFTKGGTATADFTMPAGVTSFKLVHVHENRLWGITTTYVPWYSALGNIDDWTTSGDAGAGYLNLLAYVSKGDEIEAVSTFSKAYLGFFMKEHVLIYSIGAVASEFQILQTIINTGAKSALSVMSFGNDNYYLDEDSPKSLVASTTSQELDINDFVGGVMGNYYRDLMYAASGARICMAKYTKKSWIVIHIPIGTDGGEIHIWDYAYKIWSGRWRVYDKVNSIFQDSDGNLSFASAGYVYTFDETVLNDDGEIIEFVVQTPFYHGRDPLAYERVPFMEFLSETTTAGTELEVSAFFDYQSEYSTYEVVPLAANVSLWDVALWDVNLWDASGQAVSRVRVTGRGKMHRLSFRNNQLDKDVELKYWKTFQKNLGYN